MDNFTPLSAALGGSLIGLGCAVLWLGLGRIAGISGMVGNLLPIGRSMAWRAAFILALVGGAWLASWLFPSLASEAPALVPPPAGWSVPMPIWLAAAGLLIGVGTSIGNGCTSGHGVCGLARLSPRSLVAVAVFFGTAILTVTLTGIV